MTAEIAIMNRHAIALAADSAVTISHQQGNTPKIYNSVNKLFALSKYEPVGVMVYGSADLLGVPWETILKIYRDNLSNKSFPDLHAYANDLLDFLGKTSLFKHQQETEYITRKILFTFLPIKKAVDKRVEEYLSQHRSISSIKTKHIVTAVLSQHASKSTKREQLPVYSQIDMNAFLKTYDKTIQTSINFVLEKLPLSTESRKHIRTICRNIFANDIFHEPNSGIVVAGFGTENIFPKLLSYLIEGRTTYGLRYKEESRTAISQSSGAAIRAFAQSEMVYTFMEGVDPTYQQAVESLMRGVLDNYPTAIVDAIDGLSQSRREKILSTLRSKIPDLLDEIKKPLKEYRRERHIDPVIAAIGALPKDEMASMAESLVNLTSFKRRMSTDSETVGGPIDVVVISKGDGLVWIKRKHYFPSDLNHHFFANYYRLRGTPLKAETQ